VTAAFDEAVTFITEALDELVEAGALWNTEAPPPGKSYAKLNEAATTLNRAVRCLTVLMGLANRQAIEKAAARGEKNCAICLRWLPEAEMEHHVVEATSAKGREAGRKSSWWTCANQPCKEI